MQVSRDRPAEYHSRKRIWEMGDVTTKQKSLTCSLSYAENGILMASR